MSGKQIFHEKLHFRKNASAKIQSFENFDYQPKSSEFQIFDDHLPWLRYNRPNLSEEMKNRITKKEYPEYPDYKFDRIRQKNYDLQIHSHLIESPSPKLIPSKIKSLNAESRTEENRKGKTNNEQYTLNSNGKSYDNDIRKIKQSTGKKDFLKSNTLSEKKTKNNVSIETNNGKQIPLDSQPINNRDFLKPNRLADSKIMTKVSTENNNVKQLPVDNQPVINKAFLKPNRPSDQKIKVNASTETDNLKQVSVEIQANNNADLLKTNKALYRNRKVNKSTETDNRNQAVIEVPMASNEKILRNKLSKKLKQSLTNSITISERNKIDPKKISYSKKHETQRIQFKKTIEQRPTRKEDLITNEIIESIFPSLHQSTNTNNFKQYSAYTFQNSPEKVPTDRTGSESWSVTHVSADYLDQYWAVQRQHMINKENFHYPNSSSIDDVGYASAEKDNSRFPVLNSYSESASLQRLYNKRMDYNPYNLDSNDNKFNDEHIDLITDRDLAKIMV